MGKSEIINKLLDILEDTYDCRFNTNNNDFTASKIDENDFNTQITVRESPVLTNHYRIIIKDTQTNNENRILVEEQQNNLKIIYTQPHHE